MNRFGPAPLTAAQRHAGMVQFLYSCRAKMLAEVTVDQLVQRHGVKVKDATYALTIARQKRAGELAALELAA